MSDLAEREREVTIRLVVDGVYHDDLIGQPVNVSPATLIEVEVYAGPAADGSYRCTRRANVWDLWPKIFPEDFEARAADFVKESYEKKARLDKEFHAF